MNPYPDRINELCSFLGDRYGMKDRQAVEILCGAILPAEITRVKPPWFVLETDYPNRTFDDAWFAFGGIARCESIAIARTKRARHRELMVSEWVRERQTARAPLFVIDAEWRRLPMPIQYARAESYLALLNQCLRLRIDHPRGSQGMRIDRGADRAELARLTRRVLDSDHRTLTPSMIAGIEAPKSLLYWSELVQRVAPLQTDWEALTGGLAGIGRGRAILYNDVEMADWRLSERVMRDAIPYVTRYILEKVIERDSNDGKGKALKGATAHELYRRSGGLFEKPFVNEVRRLCAEEVIVSRMANGRFDRWKNAYWRYRISELDYKMLVDRSASILI